MEPLKLLKLLESLAFWAIHETTLISSTPVTVCPLSDLGIEILQSQLR